MKERVGIVGAGASGLTAAIAAAREGAQVAVFEHMDKAGKKILATGNGRCNLSNRKIEAECFRCGQKDFPMKVIGGFGLEETLGFFEGLGIVIKERNGCLYPYSDQAASVRDVLMNEAERLGITIHLSCRIERIESGEGNGYILHTDQGRIREDALILAAGSKAAPSTGSDGSGYELARSLGHSVIKPLPALVQLRCQGKLYRQMAGVRTEAAVRVLADGKVLAEDRGELQLVEYGLSGIPIFQVSRFAARALDEGRRVMVLVDFMPAWEEGEAFGLLRKRARILGHKPMADFFTGMLNPKLAQPLLKLAGVDLSKKAGELTGKELHRILQQLKSYEAMVMSVNPFANAQVCCGGVDTRQVDPVTMESRIRKGLYFAGEILDVDGICGGYNLQFAWSSGMIAGRSAAQACKNRSAAGRKGGSQ